MHDIYKIWQFTIRSRTNQVIFRTLVFIKYEFSRSSVDLSLMVAYIHVYDCFYWVSRGYAGSPCMIGWRCGQSRWVIHQYTWESIDSSHQLLLTNKTSNKISHSRPTNQTVVKKGNGNSCTWFWSVLKVTTRLSRDYCLSSSVSCLWGHPICYQGVVQNATQTRDKLKLLLSQLIAEVKAIDMAPRCLICLATENLFQISSTWSTFSH